jgi:hypothetical protein
MEPPKERQDEVSGWQRRLLPFMVGTLAVLTLFFFVASLVQIYQLHRQIKDQPELKLEPAHSMLEKSIVGDPNMARTTLDAARWQTLTILEGNALERRYHHANMALMFGVWTRYLGFVTGMIFAMVGAAFILGKLREPNIRLDAGTSIWKFSVVTASPGLILALLGTSLMITTMVYRADIQVKDGPLYTLLWSSSEQGPTPEFTMGSVVEDGNDISKRMSEQLGQPFPGVSSDANAP